MRVLMVSDVYFPRVNGVSTSIETFRRSLAEHGVEVRLVAPRYGDEREVAGIRRIPGWKVPRDPEDRLVSWHKLRAAVREEAVDCDLIHVQTPFLAHYAGLGAARRLGRPVIATYHTLFEEYLHHYAPMLPAAWLKALARRFSRGQCNALDGVVVPSTAMRERLYDYGVTVPAHVLPTGIPLQRFEAGDRASFRERHGIPPWQPTALFVGRVAHEKNIGFLLGALAIARQRLPELLLLVTGEGPALDSLRQQVETMGLGGNVRFLGYLDRAGELPDCYAAADIFVFASRTETQGLVLLEAMAMGLPVVALAAMGTRDILAPGRGCLTPDDDVTAFAQAMLTLLEDAGLRRRLAEEARAYAREWADDRLAGRLAGLYQALAGRG
ncbi:glycosyltransferase involved in cell wall biosynthesis [Sulfuritortus calidifontis]|uniref:Glycosyltransferase involved in cell wall biosynthesis n=1 Tax=Sulfuritortus calidifontis TaxID=1914471 RepID=A0A4R3JWD1_9PROT|nr:glycosyltransferase [Sulfuritortus calidifontis]TCS71371.1 glycosyltransferase involved in cell wall biosynthesis [Sulfuritortus calidifontis]